MDEGNARLLKPVTEPIIGRAFRVANALGHGSIEKVYENALAHEMRKSGLGAVHVPQCQNDLRATSNPLRLLINFGRPQASIRRITAQA